MKIAFDLRRIKNPGIGRYMKCLVEAVLKQAPQYEYLLVMPPGAEDLIKSEAPHVARISSETKYYSIREQFALPRILRQHKIDLLHSPHFLLPLMRPCPAVVTIHDVIYLACKDDLPSRVGRLYYHGMMLAAVRWAETVITDSDFSKRDIISRLNAPAEKIKVIYPGVDPRFAPVSDPEQLNLVRSRYGIHDEFVLYTGIYKLRKNHAALLRAFRVFLDSGGRGQLVLAGPMEEGKRVLRRIAAGLGIEKNLVFPGFVPDEDLPALYSAARVYACPSLYEGFGFTVLEAMACGTPVVCSRMTSLLEVGGSGALYTDVQDPRRFADALLLAFSNEDERHGLIEEGREHAKSFNWERTATQTLAVYQAAIEGHAQKAASA